MKHNKCRVIVVSKNTKCTEWPPNDLAISMIKTPRCYLLQRLPFSSVSLFDSGFPRYLQFFTGQNVKFVFDFIFKFQVRTSVWRSIENNAALKRSGLSAEELLREYAYQARSTPLTKEHYLLIHCMAVSWFLSPNR